MQKMSAEPPDRRWVEHLQSDTNVLLILDSFQCSTSISSLIIDLCKYNSSELFSHLLYSAFPSSFLLYYYYFFLNLQYWSSLCYHLLCAITHRQGFPLAGTRTLLCPSLLQRSQTWPWVSLGLVQDLNSWNSAWFWEHAEWQNDLSCPTWFFVQRRGRLLSCPGWELHCWKPCVSVSDKFRLEMDLHSGALCS